MASNAETLIANYPEINLQILKKSGQHLIARCLHNSPNPPSESTHFDLTFNDLLLLSLTLKGYTQAEISSELRISVRTIKSAITIMLDRYANYQVEPIGITTRGIIALAKSKGLLWPVTLHFLSTFLSPQRKPRWQTFSEQHFS